MERYQRIALKISRTGAFRDIHNCGASTVYHPVNLYCETLDGIQIYVGQGFGRTKTEFQIDYSYDPNVRMRSNMRSIHSIPTQTKMLEIVQDILDGKYRKDGE